MRSSMSTENSKDNVYVNIVMTPEAGNYPNPSPARFSQTLNLTLLNNPGEYYCSCIRFSIPSDTIPILYYPLNRNQPDADVSYLVVGISVGGTNYPQTIFYVPQNNLPKPVTTLVTPPYYNDDQATSEYYFIYSITQMLSYFNTALNAAMVLASFAYTWTFTVTAANASSGAVYSDIKGNLYNVNSTIVGGTTLVTTQDSGSPFIPPASGTLTLVSGVGDATVTYSAVVGSGVTRPYWIFNPATQLFSLIVATDFLDSGMQIFLNGDAKEYLSYFNYYFNNTVTTDGYYYYLTLGDVTGTSPFTVTQDSPSLPLWFDLKKVILVTNLPINSESVPTINANTGGQEGLTSYQPILTDFIVSFETSSDIGTVLNYNPTSQYRLADMSNATPVQSLFFQFYWLDTYSNQHPLLLSPNQVASLKIAFLKKTLYNSGGKLQLKF